MLALSACAVRAEGVCAQAPRRLVSWCDAEDSCKFTLLVYWRRLHAAEVGGIRLLLFPYWLSG